MKLTRDQDILRIPAFLRKKNIAARGRKPLLLTALDRKKALDTKQKKKLSVFLSRKVATRAKMAAKPTRAKKRKTKAIKMPQSSFSSTFSAPMLEATTALPKLIPVGIMTHYYDKVKVGVIKLSKPLSVGDMISYEIEGSDAENPYEQIIESMEINRIPVFRAVKGKEIGLKLRKIPKVGRTVSKL